ncbi:nucleotidyltransferase domain-containing protein [Brachybacterium sp. Marseille-Q7125]|uniref:nucleotidyltransferase family protein n=1 Tax=Brachybacterium sp. Marseille-Q7125 TaxID=2932815 RepID=UPI001FF4F59C|nr:nucleotidyltransferase domain-containing protein [Brachybacterium sp. Marseille-Q7125]
MLTLDRDALAAISRAHNVQRLVLFGSAATTAFDPETSDADFIVEFIPGSATPFEDYFNLKAELEALLGRPVDLLSASRIENPYLAASVAETAVEVYAA